MEPAPARRGRRAAAAGSGRHRAGARPRRCALRPARLAAGGACGRDEAPAGQARGVPRLRPRRRQGAARAPPRSRSQVANPTKKASAVGSGDTNLPTHASLFAGGALRSGCGTDCAWTNASSFWAGAAVRPCAGGVIQRLPGPRRAPIPARPGRGNAQEAHVARAGACGGRGAPTAAARRPQRARPVAPPAARRAPVATHAPRPSPPLAPTTQLRPSDRGAQPRPSRRA
jgi:hypothetical protein